MCEYCENGKVVHTVDSDGFDGAMKIVGTELFVNWGDRLELKGPMFVFEINACPMCGRDLRRPKPTPIDELDFSVRTFNCLKRARIDTVEQLCAMTEAELRDLRNVNERCINEIKMKLEGIGRDLSGEVEP